MGRSFHRALFWIQASVLAATQAAFAQVIDLGDVAAGGDGTETAPAVNVGIDPRNGDFAVAYLDGPVSESDAVADGLNPSPTTSPFIDSVFFIRELFLPGVGLTHDPITQSGVVYQFAPGDGDAGSGSGWNHILKDRNGGVSALPIRVGGLEVSSAVGIHAAMGITFDLDALRDRHGAAKVGCFQTYWGLDDCLGGNVRLYAVLSNEATGPFLARTVQFTSGQGGSMEPIEIPTFARYLTLATGKNGGDICDHGTFARALITESPCQIASVAFIGSVEPRTVETGGGTPVEFTGSGFGVGMTALLGGLPLLEQAIVSPTTLRGKSPPLSAGFHAAEVIGAAGGVLARLDRAVEAVSPPAPVLTGVEPREVRRDGTTRVSVRGGNFTAATRIRIGSHDLQSPTLDSSALVTGFAPALDAAELDGPRDVEALDLLGNAILPAGVVYASPPAPSPQVVVAGVEPMKVSSAGGTPLSVRGMNFTPDMEVRVGSKELASQLFLGPTTIQGTSPLNLPAGKHALEIFHEGTLMASLPDAIEAVLPPATQSTTFSLAISGNNLTVDTENDPGPVGVLHVRLKGAEELNLPGLPLVPMLRKFVAIPRGAEVVSVNVMAGPESVQPGFSLLAWGQPDVPLADLTTPEGAAGPVAAGQGAPADSIAPAPVVLDPAVRNLDRWPGVAGLYQRVFERGDYDVVEVAVFPVQWDPQDGTIALANTIDVSIDSTGGTPPLPPEDYVSKLYNEELKRIVANPDYVRDSQAIIPDVLDAPYIIITDNRAWSEDKTQRGFLSGNMVTEFQRLAEWKTQKGLRTEVVTIVDIVSGRFGNFSAGSRDLQEVIRRFLKHARAKFHTYWVLLGGDVSVIPARYAVVGVPQMPKWYFKPGSKPLQPGSTYWDPNSVTVQIRQFHPQIVADAIKPGTAIFVASTGQKFLRVSNPASNKPGWAYVTSSSFSVETQNESEYIVLRGKGQDIASKNFYPGLDANTIPTDLYYADLAGSNYGLQGLHDWDLNDNGVYGQFDGSDSTDGVDFMADVALGRAPVESGAEAKAFVDKVLAYEKYTGVSGGFARRAIFVADSAQVSPPLAYSPSNPPGVNEYSNPSLGEANLRFEWWGGGTLMGWGGQGNYWEIPYAIDPDLPVRYHFCPDASFSSAVNKATVFVKAIGSTSLVRPQRFFLCIPANGTCDYDRTILRKEWARKQIASDAPALNLPLLLYRDFLGFSFPGIPSPEMELTASSVRKAISDGFNVLSLAGLGSWQGCCQMDLNTVPNLQNGFAGGLVYDLSSSTAAFDFDDAFGEAFVRDPTGGAAAYVGQSRSGFAVDVIEPRFWAELPYTRSIGKLHLAKGYTAKYPAEKFYNYSSNLLGDPQMPLWLGTPAPMTVTHVSQVTKGIDLGVKVEDANGPVSQAFVCVTGPRGIYWRAFTTIFGDADLSTAETLAGDALIVTATHPDHIPYQGKVLVVGESNDYHRGDTNGDSTVDISDAVALLGFLFLGGVTPPCLDAADANDDGQVDISDGIKILDYLFLGGTMSNPSDDPTPDGLGCESQS